jgi:hypothetical protein
MHAATHALIHALKYRCTRLLAPLVIVKIYVSALQSPAMSAWVWFVTKVTNQIFLQANNILIKFCKYTVISQHAFRWKLKFSVKYSGSVYFICVQKGQSAYSLFKTLYDDWPYWTQMIFPDLATQDVQLLPILHSPFLWVIDLSYEHETEGF